MRSIQKVDQNEKEIKLLIDSLKNTLTDVPYDFMYDDVEAGLIESETDKQTNTED